MINTIYKSKKKQNYIYLAILLKKYVKYFQNIEKDIKSF